jgi:hypothetical protein
MFYEMNEHVKQESNVFNFFFLFRIIQFTNVLKWNIMYNNEIQKMRNKYKNQIFIQLRKKPGGK